MLSQPSIYSLRDFRWMARTLLDAAERLCGGRLVALHEGGYSELYVPFCGLAVVEEMSGHRTDVQVRRGRRASLGPSFSPSPLLQARCLGNVTPANPYPGVDPCVLPRHETFGFAT